MLLQPDKSYFVLAMIKEVESNEARSHWTLMKKSETNNKHKINMVSSRLFYPFGLSSAIYSQMEYELNKNLDSVQMEECNSR